MILAFIITWYLIGSVGGCFISYKIYPKLTISDFIFLFTIGGLGGLITIACGLEYLPKLKFNIFFNKTIISK